MIIIDPWLKKIFDLGCHYYPARRQEMACFWEPHVTFGSYLSHAPPGCKWFAHLWPCFHGWTSSRYPTQPFFFEIPCSIGTYRNISREHLSRKVAGSCLAQNLTLVNVGAKYDEPSLLYIMNNNLDQHGGSHSDEERFLLASSGYAPFPPVISSHCVLIKVN